MSENQTKSWSHPERANPTRWNAQHRRCVSTLTLEDPQELDLRFEREDQANGAREPRPQVGIELMCFVHTIVSA